MGLFNKKEKKAKPEKAAPKKQGRPDAAPEIVHRSDKLSNVLSVTVASSSLALIKRNETFCYADKRCAIAAMLYAADIGGLSGRQAKNDQDKGQFLQQITNNHIHIHVDEDMLEEEKLLIIPDDETMDSLEEYAFLSNSSRFSGFVPTIVSWDNMGEMEFTEYPDIPKPFSWFLGVQRGDAVCWDEAEGLFAEFLGEPSASGNMSGGVAGAFAPGPAPESYEGGEIEEGWTEEPVPGDAGIGVSEEESAGDGEVPDFVSYEPEDSSTDGISADSTDPVSCPKCGSVCVNGECPNCGWSALSDEEDSEETMDTDMVIEAASHVFYKDDLQLEVSSNMFDQLVADNSFIPLEENRGEGYVREYASQLAKNCNTELRALHQKHIYESREDFLQMVVLAIGDISSEMSTQNETVYASQLDDIDKKYEEKLLSCEEQIEKRRAELEAKWEAEKQASIDAAVKKAARDYEERFSRAHDTALQDVESDIRSNLQAEKDSEVKDLNVIRRGIAQEKLQAACQNALVTVSKSYQKKLETEADIRKEYDKELTDFVNQRLEDELKRSESLIMNAKYQKELKAKDADISRRLTEMQASHDEQHQRWLTERKDMEERFAQIRADYEEKLRNMEDQSARDKEDIRGLISECATTREKVTADVAKEYELRLTQMSEENRRLEGQIQTIHENNRKLGRTSTAMWIAVAAVAALIGLILGGRVLPQQSNQGYTLRLETQAQDAAENPVPAETE